MTLPPEKPQSEARPLDPFELWRQIYESNERAWNAVLERTINNAGFAESTGKILETFLAAQKTVRDNMRIYLEQINLPTREDIRRLGELIVSLEEKVDQLDDRLSSIEAGLRARAIADQAAAAVKDVQAAPETPETPGAPAAPPAAAAPLPGSTRARRTGSTKRNP
jgi:polyhydroxyalkanoic acid synthase PhaR subunit